MAERRGATTDYHFGAEYRLGSRYADDPDLARRGAQQWLYVRGGFYTRNSPNSALFFDDRIVTLGVGFERKNSYRADVAVEMSTVSGDPMITGSLRYTLDRLFGGRRTSPSTPASTPSPGTSRPAEPAPGTAAPAAPGSPASPETK